MDITCPRCGEAMDTYELHTASDSNGAKLSYDAARRIFYDVEQGCGELFEGRPCRLRNNENTQRSRILHDMLGDDVDGIASLTD